MKVMYPAIFHKAEEGGYWVEFPDLDGCLTEGDTLEEAYHMAIEALEGYILTCMDIDKAIPKPSDIHDVEAEESDIKSYVYCDAEQKSVKLVKKTLTIPEWVNELGIRENINFSKLLTDTIIKEYQVR